MRLGFTLPAGLGDQGVAGSQALQRAAGFHGVEVGLAGNHGIGIEALLQSAAGPAEERLAVSDIYLGPGLPAPLPHGAVDVARAFGCPVVVGPVTLAARESRGEGLARVARWLHAAGALGVEVWVSNGGSFARARDLWTLLEMTESFHVKVAWDPAAAALHGETPAVSVPTLAGRIGLVYARDVSAGGAPAALGTGIVKMKQLIDRLKGIGYGGYVCCRGMGAGELAEANRQLRYWVGFPAHATDRHTSAGQADSTPAAKIVRRS